MLVRIAPWVSLGLVAGLTMLAACGSDATGSGGFANTTSGSSMSTSTHAGGGGGSTNSFVGSSGTDTGSGGGNTHGFDVTPTALKTITVQRGQSTPTVSYH